MKIQSVSLNHILIIMFFGTNLTFQLNFNLHIIFSFEYLFEVNLLYELVNL